jgi:F-type H+-transporting ATPase subunit b
MLNLSWGLMVWTLITFGVSVFVLWKYAFGPLQRLIDQRRARIAESFAAADETRAEAARLLAEYKEALAKARSDAEAIVERARKTGEMTKAEILAEAKAQAERRIEQAREQIERDTQAALREIRSQVADLAVLAAEKVTVKTLSEADHARLIEEALQGIHLDDADLERN